MRDPYLVKSVSQAARVLEAFHSPVEHVALRVIIERTGLSRGIVFRLLYTLVKSGLIEKVAQNRYRTLLERQPQRSWKIGYAAPGLVNAFTTEVSESLVIAAQKRHIQVLALDNQNSVKVALKNAERFINERVDLVIEYQLDDEGAGPLSAHFTGAGIPVIAINNPMPGAIYFGANNYQAGLLGGRALGRWANANWDGSADQIVMIDLKRAGAIGRSRLHGMADGIRETLRRPPTDSTVLFLDGLGRFEKSWQVMRRQLRLNTVRRCLVGSINDSAALGALRAFEEAGRVSSCAVCSQNGSIEARTELRKPGTRFLFSVAYFAELYGEGVMQIALDILNHRHVPPAVFTRHSLLTSQNVDHIYPNDALLVVNL